MDTTTSAVPLPENTITSAAGLFPTQVIPTTALATPLTSTTSSPLGAPSSGIPAGPSQQGNGASTAQQMQDLNLYLRRLTIGGSSDLAHIESYGGGPDYGIFLDAVSSVGLQYSWTEAQILRTVVMKLKDKAREYYGSLLPSERPTTMDEMREWFRRVFARKLTITAGKRELDRCIRNPGEPLGEYAQRLKVIANKMFPADSLVTAEKRYHRNLLLVNQFIEGLEGRLANEILRAGEFHSLDECLSTAEECEEIVSRMIPETKYDARMMSIMRVDAQPAGHGGDNRRENQELRREQYRTGRRDPEEEIVQGEAWTQNYSRPSYQSRNQHRGMQSQRGNGRIRRQVRGVYGTATRPVWERHPYMRNRCFTCGGEGHFSRGCTNERRLFCYHCGKPGGRCSLNSTRPSTPPRD